MLCAQRATRGTFPAMQLSTEEIIRLIFSLLGGGAVGGVVVGVLNLLNTNRLERKRKRIEFIRLQLQELYGPLQFLTSCNAQLFKLTNKLHEAYNAEYVNKKWSEEYNTQERVTQGALQTIDISNEYVKQAVDNNGHILEVLTNHYSLIEPADAEVFAQFVVDYTRSKTEHSASGLKMPLEIYHHLGDVSFMRPEFIAAVDKRFKEKQAELEKLLR